MRADEFIFLGWVGRGREAWEEGRRLAWEGGHMLEPSAVILLGVPGALWLFPHPRGPSAPLR